MGKKCVLRWSPTGSGIGGRTDFDALCTAVEGLRSGRPHRWSAQVQTFKAKATQANGSELVQAASGDFVVIAFTAKARFLVNRQAHQILETDDSILGLIEQLGTHTKRAIFYFEGFEYLVGDFRVRVGSVKSHSEARGVMVELEYRPLTSIQLADPILQEFCQMLVAATEGPEGNLEQVNTPLSDYSLPEKFSVQHSAIQYANLISALNR